MLIKHQMITKQSVKFCDETFTIGKALDFIRDTGYRCVPVLDKTHQYFIGNIYKVHILEYKETGSLDDSIEVLLRDKDIAIHEEDSFMKAFFTLKRYPYLPVVNDKDVFTGILTHASVLELLEEAWGIGRGSYTLTVGSYGTPGALSQMSRIINKYSDIQGVISLDSSAIHASFVRRVVFTLPKDTTKEALESIENDLENHGYRVLGVEHHQEQEQN